MSTKKDYYEILGVERSSDLGQIKKAYRQKAMEYHPDRNQHDHAAEEKFKEASEAYEVLSDGNKKQIYDQFGHAGLEGRGFHGFDRVDDIFSNFGDIFEEFFGGMGGAARKGSRSQRARAGADLSIAVEITFDESFFGVKKETEVRKEVPCHTCEGSGSKSKKKAPCVQCAGTGAVTHSQGFFMIQTTCPRCNGEGVLISDPCDDCRGQGRVREKKMLAVKIPGGVEEGMRLILRGEGNAGANGGPSGDLYVSVHIRPHAFFERRGDDLHYTLKIPMPQAALGLKVLVPTMEGEKKLEVDAGTDSGTELRFKRMGFTNVHRGHRGDQVIRVVVETPKKLSKKQKALLEEFDS